MNAKNIPQRTTNFSNCKISTLENFVADATDALTGVSLVKTNKKIEYINAPAAFDIETTSFTRDENKYANMYIWTFGINGVVTFGRSWAEFAAILEDVSETYELSKTRRLVVYVHNFAFEFQFIRKWLEWEDVFSIDERKPLYALSKLGIEFRCSYLLSGYALASLGEQLRKYPVQKMVGDLDYSLPRHNETPLTPEELKYCENDVRVVMAYIQERIENDGNITRVPLTKTGYVRKYCRDACLYEGSHKKNVFKYMQYRRLMTSLMLTPEEYKALKRAFQGGFTHANAFYSGKVVENVGSYDFTSSYPAVMVAEKFPMSSAEIVEIRTREELERNCLLYCCLFDVEFDDIEATTLFEHPISSSRCFDTESVVEDNGRIVEATRIRTTITEQDYFIIKKFYRWRKMKIGTFRRYKRGYLPSDFVKSILKLYADKTTLKGVAGREDDYLRSKEMINSCYGMCVTDICRDEIKYTGETWTHAAPDIVNAVAKTNISKRRFLFFPWGVWVTAYARRNLFSGIYEFGNDYVYSDTDSVKAVNVDDHAAYIEEYNRRIVEKLERACAFHGIDPSAIRPKTIKGDEKVLGVWDFEGTYKRFKTLGAKRYMVNKKNALVINEGKADERKFDYSLTVSGVNKKNAIPYMVEKYGDKIFDAFKDDLLIPAEYTGKMTHSYIDDPFEIELTDYRGETRVVSERSCVHLEPAEYSLSLSDAYIDYLMGVQYYEK